MGSVAIALDDERHFQIYVIHDLTDPANYVGSAFSVTAAERYKYHMRQKGGARLLNERVALGHEFKQDVVEEGYGTRGDAVDREEWWIWHLRHFDPHMNLNINITPSRGPRTIYPMSDETKAKIGAKNKVALTGKPRPDLSALYKGKPRPGGTPWLIGRSPASKGKKSPKISAAKMGHISPPHVTEMLTEWGRSRFTCDECPMVSNAAAIGTHQKASGHIGRHAALPHEVAEHAARQPQPRPHNFPYFQCDGCDLVATGGALTMHQRATDHEGRTFVQQGR